MEKLPEGLRRFLGMRERDLRAEGVFVAEGRLLVERALASGLEALAVAVSEAAEDAPVIRALPSVPFYTVSPETLDAVAGFAFHRGMLAVVRRPPDRAARDFPLPAGPVLVLPEITDPGNLGTLLRSALAFGFRAAWVGPRSCDPWNRKCLRSSMGAAFNLPLFRAESGDLARLADSGFMVLACALEPGAIACGPGGISGKSSLGGYIETGKVALVLGNEHDGIPVPWRRECALAVMIPVADSVDSLNVAVAGSILMRDFSPRGPH